MYTISQMDCVFVPLKARNIVMQSALQFTEALDEEPVQKQNCDLKGIHPFRNMPARRERTVFTNVVPKSDRTTVKRSRTEPI